MKQLLLFTALFAATLSFSQTRLIAHKSHSGSCNSYVSFADNGNFGDPGPKLRVVEKINDTTVVLTHNEWFDETRIWTDTFYHYPMFSNPNMTVDSMKKMYYLHDVEFKNFDKKPTQKQEDKQLQQTPSNEKSDEKKGVQPSEKPTGGQKKENTIWLLVIGGGVFLGGGLFSRRLFSHQKVES